MYTSVDEAVYFDGADKAEYSKTAVYFNYDKAVNRSDLIVYTLMAITPSLSSLNYGLVYGMSRLIEDELNPSSGLHRTLADTISYIFENRYIIDMEYPLFLSQYASDDEISYVKSASFYFAGYLNDTYGQEVFENLIYMNGQALFDAEFANSRVSRQEFNDTLNGYKNSWLESLGYQEAVEFEQEFYYTVYSRRYPLKAESSWMTYYFANDYREIFSLLPYDFDYSGVKNFISINEKEMAAVRDLTGYTDQTIYKTNSYLHRCESGSPVGGSERNVTYSEALYIVIHEYTHSIAHQLLGDAIIWMEEGFSEYCSRIYSSFFISYSRVWIFLDFIKDPDGELLQIYNAYMQYSSGEFNSNDFNDMFVYFQNRLRPGYFDNYASGCSLTNYLINTYGSDLFLQAYRTGSNIGLVTAYGKTFEEIKAEWSEYLNCKFSSVQF